MMPHASAGRRALAAAMLTVMALASRDALAQEGNDKAAADVLFEEGRSLLDAGKVAEACPKFAESNRLDPGIGTMLFLAECWQREGKTASAWATFREAEALATKENDKRAQVAHDRAESLAPKLATLTIVVGHAAPGLHVTRDGREVGSALWGTKTPIDPGEHTIAASATGFTPWESRVVVHAAENVNVDVPALAQAASTSSTNPEPTGRPWQKPLGVGLAAVGLAGVVVGSAFGLSAIAKNDRADSHCERETDCDAAGVALGETAQDHGNIATLGIALGAVFIVGGVILFVTSPSRTMTAQRRAPLTFTF